MKNKFFYINFIFIFLSLFYLSATIPIKLYNLKNNFLTEFESKNNFTDKLQIITKSLIQASEIITTEKLNTLDQRYNFYDNFFKIIIEKLEKLKYEKTYPQTTKTDLENLILTIKNLEATFAQGNKKHVSEMDLFKEYIKNFEAHILIELEKQKFDYTDIFEGSNPHSIFLHACNIMLSIVDPTDPCTPMFQKIEELLREHLKVTGNQEALLNLQNEIQVVCTLISSVIQTELVKIKLLNQNIKLTQKILDQLKNTYEKTI